MIRHTWRHVRVSLVREGAPARFDGLLAMNSGENAAGLARAVIGDDPREWEQEVERARRDARAFQ